jgi:hypothetical protein
LATEEEATDDATPAENPDLPSKKSGGALQSVRDWVGDRIGGVKSALAAKGLGNSRRRPLTVPEKAENISFSEE